MNRVEKVIKKIEPHDSVERYQKLGVDCISGEAKILDPYRVKVNGKTLTTKNIVVATGASPMVPLISGLDNVDFLTSDNIWDIKELPKALVVLGGGPIGCELAQAFARLGSKVTLVEMASQIMIREDEDVVDSVMKSMESEGVEVLTSHKAKKFKKVGRKQLLICEFNGQDVEIEFDQVLVALGRKANVRGFGLEELGVELADNGTIEADAFLRTKYPNIYVCGDGTGPYQFTHVAAHQAWYVSVNALFSPFKKFRVDYRVIPWVTFTSPEVARVGLNEKEAKEQDIAYELTTYGLDDLDRAIADSDDYGIVKVLTVPGKDRILGVTIVGANAGEMIAEFVLAMKHGLGLNKILGTIHVYPTHNEGNKYVAGNWKKQNKPKGLLRVLRLFHSWNRGC